MPDQLPRLFDPTARFKWAEPGDTRCEDKSPGGLLCELTGEHTEHANRSAGALTTWISAVSEVIVGAVLEQSREDPGDGRGEQVLGSQRNNTLARLFRFRR